MRKPLFLLVFTLFWMTFPLFAGAEEAPEGMVFIEGGCFKMGTDEIFQYQIGVDNFRERPAHQVCVDDFYMDKMEATQKEWEEVMGHHESVFKGPNLPIAHISWEEANEFCTRQGTRLPTEAEWEYAARAGSQTLYPWGDEIDGDYVWYLGNSIRRLPPVGTKKPNAWGLHDMIGSVWEWVADWYSDHYYENSPVDSPQGPRDRTSWHVIRGGSWVDEWNNLRVSVRHRGLSDHTLEFWVGVRCAATPEKKEK